jgi:hypothetical protein
MSIENRNQNNTDDLTQVSLIQGNSVEHLRMLVIRVLVASIAVFGLQAGGLQFASAAAPVFTSSTSANFPENSTGTVIDVNADAGATYSIIPSTVDPTSYDSTKFAINSENGFLTFLSSPDFED